MNHPERRTVSPLGGKRHDRIEKEAVVPPDRERQVARRVGVAGTDRPPVGVVDHQAAEPDEQARPQLTPAAEDGGHGSMLTCAGFLRGPSPLRGWGKAEGYHKAPPSGSAAAGASRAPASEPG